MSASNGESNREKLGRWIWVLPLIGLGGVVVVLIYVSQVPGSLRWSAFGTSVAIAGAAAALGGLVGFLFGIPRTVQGSATSANTQFQGNTNLEQVSDWLTKIIVGVALVQIGRALPALGKLGQSLKGPLGGLTSGPAFGLGVVIGYASLGFLFLYLWSRERLPQELLFASTMQQTLDAREAARTNALSLVNKQLNSLKGGPGPTQADLNEAIAAAPGSTRLQVFNEAESVRSENWEEPRTKPLMALSIPVFRALIAADSDNLHHRSHGSLGWALKDQADPEWQGAFDQLGTAIAIRDRMKIAGWRLYEANRALCGIELYAKLEVGDPSAAHLRTTINQDLQAALADPSAKRMVDTNEMVQHWITHPPNDSRPGPRRRQDRRSG